MSNKRNAEEFLNYIRTPLSQNSLNVLYSANHIKYERCQLFSDFIESLIIKLIDTYMGDSFTKPQQRIEHFKWCWDENKKDFSNENINLKESQELFYYFQQFMVESFYKLTDKDEIIGSVKERLIRLWNYILSYTTNKTRSDFDTFLDVYRLFEKTL